MNLVKRLVVTNVLLLATASASAQSYDGQTTDQTSQNTSDIASYMKNWAAYFGYDITITPTTSTEASSTQLIDSQQDESMEVSLFSTFFGSIPVTTPANSGSSQSGAGMPFVPTSATGASAINSSSNLTFQNYQSANQTTTPSVNSLLDQSPYQSDPVSQSIFNILGTPDVSYCITYASDGTTPTGVANPTNPNTSTSSCSTLGSTLFQNQVMANVLGTIPSQTDFYTITNNQNIIPQLNSNSLIAPLYYSTTAINTSSSTSGDTSSTNSPGLTAQNQIQLANNFIRYVSGAVMPTILPNLAAYQSVYSTAMATTTNNPVGQAQAQAVLSNYILSLRVFAAQTSVGIGNLYYILSRRLPQTIQSTDSSQSSSTLPSQALNEYNMATWRIYNPASTSSGTSQNQWVDMINTATPLQVQKEIAVLLSEINYQLYLDRQIHERLLLTSSVSLLQGTKATQPNSDLSNQNTAASSATPGSATSN